MLQCFHPFSFPFSLFSCSPVTYTQQSGTNKQDDGFNFDLFGNILKILNRVNDCGISGSALGSDALDRNFEYDPLYRVISGDGRESNTQNQNDYLYNDAPAPGSPNANNVRAYTRKYAFDKLGNIQQLKQLGSNGFTRNFTYNTGYNTLQKIETAAPSLLEDFTYDACGNQLTAGTTRNYVWNAGDQLVTYYNQVGSADPTIFAQYDYSGMNRVSKFVKTGTSSAPVYERTIYIDGIFEYHILENGNTVEKNYIHLLDDRSRIAMIRVGDQFPDDIADLVAYNLEDQIGSSVLRLTNTGTTIDKEEYYPFGDSSLRTFSKKRYRYVGKEKDQESGLYYYGARYYAAWTCRFISVDPLAAKYPGISAYAYAFNNPIMFNDPTGMEGKPVSDSSNVILNNVDISNVEMTPQKIGTDFLNIKTGESIHIQNGIDQIAVVDDKTFNNLKELSMPWNTTWDESETILYFQSLDNATLYKPNEFGMYQFPESGNGFERYTTASGTNNGNNENYSVNGKKHTTDNWASKDTFLGFYKTIQDFYSETGVTTHYGDISAYNPKINLGHSTHYTGESIDIHYFDSNGFELRGDGAYASASVELVNSFFQHAQNNGFTKNYSYGSRFTHIGNNNQGVHKDHLHIGR